MKLNRLVTHFKISESILNKDLQEIKAVCQGRIRINISKEFISLQLNGPLIFNEIERLFAHETLSLQILNDIIFAVSIQQVSYLNITTYLGQRAFVT